MLPRLLPPRLAPVRFGMPIFRSDAPHQFLERGLALGFADANYARTFNIQIQRVAAAQFGGVCDWLGYSHRKAVSPFGDLCFHGPLPVITFYLQLQPRLFRLICDAEGA